MKHMLKMIMTAAIVFCVAAGMASASIVPCSSISNVDLNSATLSGAGNGCNVGSVVFSNFGWSNAGIVAPPNVVLTDVRTSGNEIFLDFNPMMGPNADIHMMFTVTGGILGMDLSNTTGPSSVNEANYGSCSGGNLAGVANAGCTLLVQTGSIVGAGGNFPGPSSTGEFLYGSTQTSVWVFKDLNTSRFGATAENSGFTESFVVPEPTSMLLLGMGLVGVGLIGRRRFSK